MYDTTNNPEYLYKCAISNYELKNYRKAFNQFETLRKYISELESIPEKTILKYMIRCCLRFNDLEAIEKYISYFDYNSDKELFCVYSEKLTEAKKYGPAVLIYENILKKDSNNIAALTGLARICNIQKDYRAAMVYYRKILNARPDLNEIYYELGKVYKKSGNYISAIEIFMKGLGISTGELKFNILSALAHCFIESEEYEAAVEHLIIGASEYKGDKDKRLEMLYLLGLCYYNLKRNNDAKKVWNEVYRNNPGYSDVSLLLEKLYTPKSIDEIVAYLNNIDKNAANKISEELCGNFHIQMSSYNYKKNIELLISAFEKSEKIIISVKLWPNAAGDIVLFDFREIIKAQNARRGILMLPAGFSGGSLNSEGGISGITVIVKNQFSEIFNKILRMVGNA